MRDSSQPKIDRYDFNQLKTIPILTLARDLGLDIRLKGKRHWCQVRPEDHEPSCILHEDTNRFYDFGTHQKGDVIEFVKYVKNVDLDIAQEWMGRTYGFTPKNRQSGNQLPDTMTLWDYEAIGIYGDMASKNLPLEVLYANPDEYSIGMNDLRKKDIKTYTGILINKALPYVAALRNNYYLDVWSMYELVKEIGSPQLFQAQCDRGVFDAAIKELEKAEHMLVKAAKGTYFKAYPPGNYDPMEDLKKLISGSIKPKLGNLSYNDIQKLAKDAGCEIQYTPLDYLQYNNKYDLLNSIPHQAFLRSGTVNIGYLETDYGRIMTAINSSEKSLDEKISDAKTTSGREISSNPTRESYVERRD